MTPDATADLDHMHPGILAWLHYRLGWPVYSASIAEMHPEDAAVLRFLLSRDMQAPPASTVSQQEVDAHHARIRERLQPE